MFGEQEDHRTCEDGESHRHRPGSAAGSPSPSPGNPDGSDPSAPHHTLRAGCQGHLLVTRLIAMETSKHPEVRLDKCKMD